MPKAKKRMDVWTLLSFVILAVYGLFLIYPLVRLLVESVLKDGRLGVSESDRFIAPAEMTVSGDCSGVGDAASGSNSETEYYFEQ